MTMNFSEQIEDICLILRNSHFNLIADEILDKQLSAGTGGEVLISVCSFLLDIKVQRPEVYKIIELPSQELVDYSKSLGLYPQRAR